MNFEKLCGVSQLKWHQNSCHFSYDKYIVIKHPLSILNDLAHMYEVIDRISGTVSEK